MSAAHDEILARIRRAHSCAEDRERAYAAIPREYRRTGSLDAEARIALFTDRLHDYNAAVYRCAESRIAETVAEAMTARGKRRLMTPSAFPKSWLPEGFEFTPGQAATVQDLDDCEGVLTGCAVAAAFTGTIVLVHGANQARRALTLVPDYHLCVVQAAQLVETWPEAVARLREFRHLPLTTISGPSATSDIEMTRVKGVHGPRVLDVLLVG